MARKTVPWVLQAHESDCGAAALAMVLESYGRVVSLGELQSACRVTERGCSALDLVRASERYGLRAAGMRVSIGELHRIPLPLIVLLGGRHFVVLAEAEPARFRIQDPAGWTGWIPAEEFARGYPGSVVAFAGLE